MDPSSFSEYINAYKEYIVDVAEVMSNYVGEAVPRPILMAAADNIFNFEQELATVSAERKSFYIAMAIEGQEDT